MRTDLFDFELPATSIALRPASPRDSARMLVVQTDGVLHDRSVAELPQWLQTGDATPCLRRRHDDIPDRYAHRPL